MTIKISAGKRAKPEVIVILRSVNEKMFTLPNGTTLTEGDIARWITKHLEAALISLGGKGDNP